jgi:hypothetical protein
MTTSSWHLIPQGVVLAIMTRFVAWMSAVLCGGMLEVAVCVTPCGMLRP